MFGSDSKGTVSAHPLSINITTTVFIGGGKKRFCPQILEPRSDVSAAMGPTCVLPGSHTEEFYATHGNDSAWEEGLACLRRHCGAPQQAAAERHEPPPAAAPPPAVLLADGSLGNAAESEPARGPDSAARERAHQQLVELAWQGTGPSLRYKRVLEYCLAMRFANVRAGTQKRRAKNP